MGRVRHLARTALSVKSVVLTQPYIRPGHYYSPVSSREDADRAVRLSPQLDASAVDLHADEQIALAESLAPMWADARPAGGRYDVSPSNHMFPQSDASVLASILRQFQPARVVEIGCGYSSAIALDTAERFELPTTFTFIEPYADRLRSVLRSTDSVELIEKPVQDVPLRRFEELEDGDILFIDSTHVVKAGSDVWWEVAQILPRLAPGVIVHFHDIFWPFEYQPKWLLERRDWTEAYLLHAFLAYNDSWRILLFNDWLWREQPRFPAEFLPETVAERPGGLWLRRDR